MPRIETFRPRRIAGVALVLLGYLIAPIRAEDHDATVFRSTTRLVQLNVIVVDDHNQPVTDLSEGDFQVITRLMNR